LLAFASGRLELWSAQSPECSNFLQRFDVYLKSRRRAALIHRDSSTRTRPKPGQRCQHASTAVSHLFSLGDAGLVFHASAGGRDAWRCCTRLDYRDDLVLQTLLPLGRDDLEP